MGQVIRWMGFVVSNSITRSCVHFFPASDAATAPYPATCTLTLFGSDIISKSVSLEGGRLGYPDGVRVEDAFPVLKTLTGGTYGLVLEISTSQPRLDLTGSGCIVDLHSQGLSAHFRPVQLGGVDGLRRVSSGSLSDGSSAVRFAAANTDTPDKQGKKAGTVGLAMHDRFHTTSLMIVNGSRQPLVTQVTNTMNGDDTGNAAPEMIRSEIPSQSVTEIPISESMYKAGFSQECGWGTFQAVPLRISYLQSDLAEKSSTAGDPDQSISQEDPSEEVLTSEGGGKAFLSHEIASYLLYRDLRSRRVSSVVGL